MDDWNAIRQFPEYRELTRERRRVVLPAAVVYLGGYFGFLIVAGTAPAALGHRVHGGLNVGWILIACVFVLVWAVAFVYIRVANARLDRQADAVAEKAAELLARTPEAAP